jgi:dTDP-4-dehydrorhamnose 3,5-epimerase
MLKDLIIKKLDKNTDARGWLSEIWREDESAYRPAMAYVSITESEAIRGPHEHKKQSDGFVFLGPGNFELYLWDNRPDSPTFKETLEMEVGESNPVFVLVPPGIVHGYKCISEKAAYCINLPDALYAGVGKKEAVDEIRHEKDPQSPFKII